MMNFAAAISKFVSISLNLYKFVLKFGFSLNGFVDLSEIDPINLVGLLKIESLDLIKFRDTLG